MNAADIQATLEFLVPGFIALKVFYVFGLRTRRSDFGWTVFSIAGAAILNAFVVRLGITDPSAKVLAATVVGVVAALAGAVIWRYFAARFASARAWFDRQAWDATWSRPAWVQVWVRDGPIILGAPSVVSESAETDDHDVYLAQPSWVDRETGDRQQVTGVIGMWVSARDIQMIQVLDPDYRPPDRPAAAPHGAE